MALRSEKSLGVRKGAWTHEEDLLLKKCMEKHGIVKWSLIPKRAGLNRCPKSCRLRWLNYLCPSIKRGMFDNDEVDLIIRLHKLLGNRWSLIAGRIPGRTANDVKNYWNTHFSKKHEAKDEKEMITTPAKVFKPIPKAIPSNWSWSKDRTEDSRGKYHQGESSSSKQQLSLENSEPCLDSMDTAAGTVPIAPHITENEMISEELQVKLAVEDFQILRNDEFFMEGFNEWEGMDYDMEFWGDLGGI